MITIEEVLKKIKTCRKSKGFSQEYIASKLDINQAAYAKIENQTHKLSVERLIQIAEILKQPISCLLQEESCKENNYIDLRNMNKELVNKLSIDNMQINLLKILLEK